MREALEALAHPLFAVVAGGRLAFATDGNAQVGRAASDGDLPLVAHVPALLPESLGDASFRRDHGVRFAYVVGEMANGIASEDVVAAAAAAGGLGFFGAAGLTVERVEQALARLERTLGAGRFGSNLIHSPDDPGLEDALVRMYLRRGLARASASAYLDLTLPVVRYRTAGIHRGDDGRLVVPHHLMAKVSRAEVARKFLEPAPEHLLAELRAAGDLTEEQVELARQIPMADDVTAEADSGGHTDNRPLVLLLPAMQALRDEVCAAHPEYRSRPRIGAAGGIATPAATAAAFSLGAAYVMTGSVNQACREAATSEAVKQLLAQASPADVAMAPAADMFEMGVRVQVLTRGTLFAARAAKLYELYRTHDSLEALPAAARSELEQKFFRQSLEAAWQSCETYFREHDPRQLERAAREPKHKLALLFRAYLGQASGWANDGVADRRADYQVWCGPGMGAFNAWAKGSILEGWEGRHVGLVAGNLIHGAAYLTRVAALRSQGIEVPPELERFAPRPSSALDVMVAPPQAPSTSAQNSVVHSAEGKDPEPTAPRDEPIAIVGIGAMFPSAKNVEELWRLIRTGQDAITDVPATHWSVADYYDPDPRAPDRTYAKRGAFLDAHGFDPTEFGIPPAILEATDTSQLLALAVAKMAFEDAGLREGGSWNRSRTSVLLGVTGTQELVISLGARLGHPHWRRALRDAGVDAKTAEDVVERISRSYVGWQESSFPGLLGNVVAGRIANRFDLGGTNCVIDAACASSLGAVHLGMLELRAGRSDVVLTGGVDCLNDIFMHMCFSKTPALSATGDVRPFSDKADGTLLGEGLGMVVLKRLADAERDGDRVYASIRSVGTSSDGRAKSIYAPLPSGQARALRDAYAGAHVRPRDIELVEAHGTGTKAGDLAEVQALREVYGDDSTDATWCALGSVKSQLGHTKAAAGAAGLIKAALALHHRTLPPTIKVDVPNPALKLETSPFYLSTEARPWIRAAGTPRRAAVSSFGFGGSNFHLVLEEHARRRAAPSWTGAPQIFAFSSSTRDALVTLVHEASQSASSPALLGSTTRAKFRGTDAYRLLVVIPHGASVARVLADAAQKLSAVSTTRGTLSEGVFYGSGAPAGKLAFLFPGQGSQQVNMLRDLALAFPELHDALNSSPDIAAKIFPPPSFDAQERNRQAEALTATDVAQPALAVVESALLSVLAHLGVRPELAAGHSFGELVALRSADVLDDEGLRAASALRGQLMRGDGADRGTMLAVIAPLVEIERAIADARLDLVLANRNTPTQGVLSGARTEIERAERLCHERSWRTSRLAVGAAFHSPLVSGASSEFAARLEAIPFKAPTFSVVSDTTAEVYPAGADAVRALLARQLASPVRFAEVVERVYALGARTFLEVGPRSVLTGMVSAILADRSYCAMAVDAGSRRGGMSDLAFALCQLAAEGHPVDLSAWMKDARVAEARKPAMVVPLTGANYRSPHQPLPAVMKPAVLPSVGAAPTRTGVDHHAPAAAVAASPAPPRAPAGSPALTEALRLNQENIAKLQALHEQTARVHQTFLEGQLAAQQQFGALLAGQRGLYDGKPTSISAVVVAQPAPAPISAPTPPAAVPSAVAPHAPTPAPTVDVRRTLLEVVAESTGYPVDSLELKMDLEADLGIDSIKRVEILSLLSKRVPNAPRVNPEKLSGLRTLAQVAEFVGGGANAPSAPNGIAHVQPATPASSPLTPVADPGAILLEAVAELTGYPRDTLALTMDLEADLGIDSIKRVEILSLVSKRIPNAPNANPEKLSGLRTLQQVLAYVTVTPSALVASPPTPPASVAIATRTTPMAPLARAAVVPVRAAPPEKPLTLATGEVVVVGTDKEMSNAIATAFAARQIPARACSYPIDLPKEMSGLVLVAGVGPWTAAAETEMKAMFGAAQVASAALRRSASNGGALLATVSRLDGAFGHLLSPGTTRGIQLAAHGLSKTVSHEWPGVTCRAIDLAPGLPVLDAAKTVVEELLAGGQLEVGVGGAGRVVLGTRDVPRVSSVPALQRGELVVVTGGARGVTAACAEALGKAHGVELLLLGRSSPSEAEPEWLAAAVDDSAIKRALLEHAPPASRPTPRELGEQARAILSGREIRETLAALRQAGVTATYRAVDIRDGKRLETTLAEVAAGRPIRGIVHGAGVLRDRRIEDKTAEDFAHVFDTKVAGLRNLLALAGDELRFLALFSSVSGRCGRRGQSDYAMANSALVSIAQAEAVRRPGCHVVALDWGPWDGGMVTPALRREFEREGVEVIPLEAGARLLADEAVAGSAGFAEYLAQVGDVPTPAPSWALASAHRLNATSYPLLGDHRLGGKHVLPLAIAMEWLAEGAVRSLPGAELVQLHDIRLLRGISFGTSDQEVAVWVGPPETDGKSWRVKVELRDGTDAPRVRATAVIGARSACPEFRNGLELRPQPRDGVYAGRLFHGPLFQVIRSVSSGRGGIECDIEEPLISDRYIAGEARRWLSHPLACDAVFQALILWSREFLAAPSLPARVERVQFFRGADAPVTRLHIRVRDSADTEVIADADLLDAHGQVIGRLEGCTAAVSSTLEQSFTEPVREPPQLRSP